MYSSNFPFKDNAPPLRQKEKTEDITYTCGVHGECHKEKKKITIIVVRFVHTLRRRNTMAIRVVC